MSLQISIGSVAIRPGAFGMPYETKCLFYNRQLPDAYKKLLFRVLYKRVGPEIRKSWQGWSYR